MKSVYVLPGKWHLSRGGELVTTILGSCVSVILFEPRCKVSVLTHYLLPEYFPERYLNQKPSARFGDIAIKEALQALKPMACQFSSLQAKVYGGANMAEGNLIGESVGASNIIFAFQTLSELGIPVVEQNVGGFQGRKIILNTDTFEVSHYFSDSKAKVG